MKNIPDLIIAVDGFSSTGKSSFARMVARDFGYLYLDSGALYRGVTLFAMDNGFITSDREVLPALEPALPGLDLHFGTVDGVNSLFIGNDCVEDRIRSMEVSALVSPVAAVPYVRDFVDSRLRSFGESGRVVMDGRDIGTSVFPNAHVKVFMTASEDIRARRRYDELLAKGTPSPIEDVMRNIRERDYIDSHREVSPLRQAEDAFVLDNSSMTMEEELAWIKGLIQGKFSILE